MMLVVSITALGLTGIRPVSAIPTDPCDWDPIGHDGAAMMPNDGGVR